MLLTMHLYFLIQMMVLVGVTKGLLLDGGICTTGNLCGCSIVQINCGGLELKDVLFFNVAVTNIAIRDFYFSYNAIDTLRNGSFNFLKNLRATLINLYFDNNNLSAIEDGCFEEIQNVIVYLELKNNNLHTISIAISTLTHLASFLIMYNPITYFDPKVLVSIGDTLQRLEISLTNVSRWPNVLHFLYNMQDLITYGLSAHTISASDFQYITHIKFLQTLYLQHTDSVESPVSLCGLSRLITLNLDYNNFTGGGNDMFSICHRPLANMLVISLGTNQLKYFPDLRKAFPAINEIDLSMNNIRYLTNELTAMPLLKQLDLSNNKLCHIPLALASIGPNLENLLVEQNFIVEIDNRDLAALQNLVYLQLTGNTSEYIAEHAFVNNPDLQFLFLSSTKLLTIPCALSNAFNHEINVYLEDIVIECDCRMKCLNNITLSSINIFDSGCQQTGLSIKNVIQNVIKADSCG